MQQEEQQSQEKRESIALDELAARIAAQAAGHMRDQAEYKYWMDRNRPAGDSEQSVQQRAIYRHAYAGYYKAEERISALAQLAETLGIYRAYLAWVDIYKQEV